MTITLTRYRDQVDRSGESQVKGGQASCSDRASVWGRGGMLIALGGVLMLGAEAMGQVGTRHRAKVITPVGSPSVLHLPGFGDNTFGINNKSECCGGYVTGGKVHAWLWLPQAADSFSAHTLYDLHTLAGLPTGSPAERSFANSLSDDREIVGEYEIVDNSLAFSHALAWDATTNTSPTPMSYTDLHPSTGYGPTSIAFAINNISPAQVSGSIDVHLCGNGQDIQWIRRGFMGTSNGSVFDVLGQFAGNSELFAFDLTPSPTLATATKAVGRGAHHYTYADEGECEVEQHVVPETCGGLDYDVDPYLWAQISGFVAGELERLDPCTTPAKGGGEARGTNDAGDIVGFAKVWPNSENPCTGFGNCPTRATLTTGWSVPQFDLGAIMPGGQENHDSRAEAISNGHQFEDYIRVVGWNDTLNIGLGWERDALGSWCVRNYNDITVTCGSLTVQQVYDVNVYGHAVALALDSGNAHQAVFLTCRADLNFDARVNTADRTLLFEGWKTAACVLDIDGDGYADEDDLAILIATWSSDDYCHVEPLCDSIESFSQGMSLEEALMTLNFTDADDFVEWALNAEPESVETTWELLRILMTCC